MRQSWLKPWLAQLEGGQVPRLLEDLRAALAGLKAEPRAHLEREIGCSGDTSFPYALQLDPSKD